ncbi:MAG TPA: helix-turn-helix domain-containing protein [Jatrophihabitantaceae bacterium]
MSYNIADETSRPLRKDALRNRQKLLRAAREVFAARGLEASMDDVAHHAGVGVGTAYRHFANKHDLAAIIFDNTVTEIADLAEQAVKTADPWEGLVGFLEATLDAQTTNRALREILTAIYADERGPHHDTVTAPFTTLVERAKAEGAIRPDVQASDVSMLVLMLCTVTDASAGQSPFLWRRYLPILLDGLRRETAPMPVAALTPEQLRATLTR